MPQIAPVVNAHRAAAFSASVRRCHAHHSKMKASAKLIPIAATLSLVALATAQDSTTAKPNLLTNPSFEDGQTGWEFHPHEKRGTATVDTVEKHEGKNSIRIENPAGDDSFLRQAVAVKPKTRYRFTGYIKTKDVVVKGSGAVLCLEGGYEKTESITGKKGWTKVSFEFDSGVAETVKVGPRLGYYSSMAMGIAWFDDLQLVEIGPSRKR
jgi:hypothetical protein